MKKIAYALLYFVATNIIAAVAAMPENDKPCAARLSRTQTTNDLLSNTEILRELTAERTQSEACLALIRSALGRLELSQCALTEVKKRVQYLIDVEVLGDIRDTLRKIDEFGTLSGFAVTLPPSPVGPEERKLLCEGSTCVALGLTTYFVSAYDGLTTIPGIDTSSEAGRSNFLDRLRMFALPKIQSNMKTLAGYQNLLESARENTKEALGKIAAQQRETENVIETLRKQGARL